MRQNRQNEGVSLFNRFGRSSYIQRLSGVAAFNFWTAYQAYAVQKLKALDNSLETATTFDELNYNVAVIKQLTTERTNGTSRSSAHRSPKDWSKLSKTQMVEKRW